jgi:hypothetical protein
MPVTNLMLAGFLLALEAEVSVFPNQPSAKPTTLRR